MNTVSNTITAPEALGARDYPVPLRPCEPWCEIGEGHPDEMAGDRNCLSKGRAVVLGLHEPFRGSDNEWYMPYLEASLRRDRTAGGSVVVFNSSAECHGRGDEHQVGEIEMALDEAEAFALGILAEVRAARGEHR